MCRFKSGIILKDRVFIPDYDSHEDMLGELKIEDTEDNAKRLFVRAELVPPRGDVFALVSEWEYHVDQDILPDWYVAEVDEQRMREAVTELAKERIHVGEKIEKIDSGTHWIKDCTVKNIYGSAKIGAICGLAKIGAICGSAKIGDIYGLAKIGDIYDSAKIGDIYDSAKIGDIYGSAKIGDIYGSAKIGAIYGSAKIGDIYDSAEIETIYGSAKIGDICGLAKIGAIYGSATVITSKNVNWENKKSVCIKDEAVLIDRYDKKIYHSGAFETVIAGGQRK